MLATRNKPSRPKLEYKSGPKAKPRNGWKRLKPTDVFKRIDMKGGDTDACWYYLLTVNRAFPSGVFYAEGGRRFDVRRLVFSLYYNMRYEDVPYLKNLCRDRKCCNPLHAAKKKESSWQ